MKNHEILLKYELEVSEHYSKIEELSMGKNFIASMNKINVLHLLIRTKQKFVSELKAMI